MLREQVFSDISRYAKKINPEYAAQIAEHKEKVGFTDYDALGAPKRKVQRTDAQLRELEGIEKAKAEARAQAEHQAALARLADGTAIHRQKKERTPLPKKVKPVKPVKPIKKRVAKKVAAVDIKEPSFHQLAKIRRDGFIADLQAGKMVKMVPQCKKNNQFNDYQTQHTDLMYVRRHTCLELLRLNRIKTGESFFILDNFARHEPIRVGGNLKSDDRDLLVQAVTSGKLFGVSNVDRQKACSSSMAQLVRRHGMDIYTVFIGRKLIGWIMPGYIEVALTEEDKRNEKAAELGGMLQAIDYLNIRKKMAVRMPDATAGEIEEAAFQEFKKAGQ